MRKVICLTVVVFLLLFEVPVSAFQPYRGYTYDEWDSGILAAIGYGATVVHYGDADGKVTLDSPQDMCIDEDGRICVLGSGDKGITILNSDFTFVKKVNEFVLPDGTPYALIDARSVEAADGKIIIADYENMTLVVSDYDGNILQLIEKPTNPTFPSEMEFRPYSVTVDSDGNIYALILEIYQGAAVFTPSGEFKGFYGSNKVTPTLQVLADQFWKKLMNETQRDQLSNYVPQPIKNMAITEDGFMYCCTETCDYGNSNLRCINPYGEDVWKGTNATGDLEYAVSKESILSTEFVDVAVSDTGYIFGLDSTMGRVFMYDLDHNLVFSFGGLGKQAGVFSDPTALEVRGSNVYVLDSAKNSITVFEPTEYGAQVVAALDMYFDSRYAESVDLWNQVLKQNGNEANAYDGIGKALLYSGEYREAMEYFRLAGNRTYESRAFELYRTQLLRKFFPQIVLGVFVAVCILMIVMIARKFRRRQSVSVLKTVSITKKKSSKHVWKEYFHTLIHPIDSFDEIRYKKSGSVWISGLFVAFFFLFTLMERHMLAFRFNTYTVENTNVLLIFLATVLLVVLAVLSNWGLSTLWDGKADMRLIWIVFGYALSPYVVSILLRTLLSGLLTVEEGVFTGILTGLCLLWSGLLLWFGLLQTQEFTVKKNILCILCTVAGMALLLLLGFLVIMLFQEFFVFLGDFGKELLQRLA